MKITNIEYPTALSQITDIKDDNIDIFVKLDDGFSYTLVVLTQKILKH